MLAGLLALLAQPAAQVQVTGPFTGVTYVDRWDDAPRRVHMHVVQIDLQAPGIRFKVSTMAMTDPKTGLASIVNVSSDNAAGRDVATSLAVFARRP